MQEAYENANAKNASLEKIRHKLLGELEDAQVDVEKVSTNNNFLSMYFKFLKIYLFSGELLCSNVGKKTKRF